MDEPSGLWWSWEGEEQAGVSSDAVQRGSVKREGKGSMPSSLWFHVERTGKAEMAAISW